MMELRKMGVEIRIKQVRGKLSQEKFGNRNEGRNIKEISIL